MTQRLLPLVLAALVGTLVVAAGFAAGRALNGGEGSDTSYEFDLAAPPYSGPLAGLGKSTGGFTGFGDAAALEGTTLISGLVTAVSGSQITIKGGLGAEQTLDVDPSRSVARFKNAAQTLLAEGQQVLVATDSAGTTALAILVLAQR